MAPNSRLFSRLDLASGPFAVRRGRRYASLVLTDWGIDVRTVDVALLIVSELLTNAVRHARPQAGRGRDFHVLLLRLAEKHLTVAVQDFDPHPPVLRHAALDDEGGRGLMLVQRQSQAWGHSPCRSGPGKVVWARLALAEVSSVPVGPTPQPMTAASLGGV